MSQVEYLGKMKVYLSEIPPSGLTLSEEFDPVRMNLQTSELTFFVPPQITALFKKVRDMVMVEVKVRAQQECVCGRCLRAYPKEYEEHFSLSFSVKNEQFLDATDEIRQEILLSYPMRFLCSEECLGLCPSCGKNLNLGPCSCAR